MVSGLNIKNPEAEAKIRELAALTGTGLTEAVLNAVDAQLGKIHAQRAQNVRTHEIDAICARFQAAWGRAPVLPDDALYSYLDEEPDL